MENSNGIKTDPQKKRPQMANGINKNNNKNKSKSNNDEKQ